jgi:hypothetical protein
MFKPTSPQGAEANRERDRTVATAQWRHGQSSRRATAFLSFSSVYWCRKYVDLNKRESFIEALAHGQDHEREAMSQQGVSATMI